MAYAFRYLSAAEQTSIKTKATAKPAALVVDEGVLRAWEADLAAHQALAASKTGEDKKPHDDAITVLEKALNAGKKP